MINRSICFVLKNFCVNILTHFSMKKDHAKSKLDRFDRSSVMDFVGLKHDPARDFEVPGRPGTNRAFANRDRLLNN